MNTTTLNYRPAGDYLTRAFLAGDYSPEGAALRDGALWLPVTADNLTDLMEFDHVIEVHENGDVTERNDLYAPELWGTSTPGDTEVVPGWTLMTGYSGQDRYPGPIMHNSEYLGGRMAEDVLSTPGVYVILVCMWDPTEDDMVEGFDPETDGPILEGWAVARREA